MGVLGDIWNGVGDVAELPWQGFGWVADQIPFVQDAGVGDWYRGLGQASRGESGDITRGLKTATTGVGTFMGSDVGKTAAFAVGGAAAVQGLGAANKALNINQPAVKTSASSTARGPASSPQVYYVNDPSAQPLLQSAEADWLLYGAMGIVGIFVILKLKRKK